MNIESELAGLKSRGLFRELKVQEGIDFCSNDFLGLSHSQCVREALIAYLEQQGPLGSTGSRLVSGESAELRETEHRLAALFQAPHALFFGSGYLANLGVLSALGSLGGGTGRGGTGVGAVGVGSVCAADGGVTGERKLEFFSDELNHASLIDGIRLSRNPVQIVRHNDLDHLSDLLCRSAASLKVVVTESVFSMDGDGPDLESLVDVVDRAGAWLVLDEAHATGVLGANGLGSSEGVNFNFERTIIVHTCGKALGGYGAFVVTSRALRDLIINRARSFIFSTAPSPLQILQTETALKLITEGSALRVRLWQNVQALQAALETRGIAIATATGTGTGATSPRQVSESYRRSYGHILPIQIPGNARVMAVTQQLATMGLWVRAIRSPTVAEGSERLRITVKSFHTEGDLDLFCRALDQALDQTLDRAFGAALESQGSDERDTNEALGSAAQKEASTI